MVEAIIDFMFIVEALLAILVRCSALYCITLLCLLYEHVLLIGSMIMYDGYAMIMIMVSKYSSNKKLDGCTSICVNIIELRNLIIKEISSTNFYKILGSLCRTPILGHLWRMCILKPNNMLPLETSFVVDFKNKIRKFSTCLRSS